VCWGGGGGGERVSVFGFDLIVDSLQVGAADYIAVAENYHTVFISDIPMMSMQIRDKVVLLIVGLFV
jgi:predicted ATPase